jgi:hypothetical protein
LLCTQSGYCWHRPLPHGADFGDAAFSGETGWAVAGGGIIQRYERGDWAPSRAPTSSHLRGVSGDGSSSWAVGDGGVVLNWNGTQWNEVAVPTSEDLNAVWQQTPDDVWVAGNAGALLHFDGTDWIAETGVSGVDFLSLWGNGSDEVWLGGRSGVMRHHAGAGWQVVDSGTTFDVYDIWGASGTDLWATASNYSCTVLVFCNAHGRVLRGGTSGFADVFSRNTNFRTLWARSAESVWVGGTGASYEGSEAGFSALGNSSHYTKIRGAEPRPTFAFGTRGVIRTWNGASWSTSRDEHLEGAIVDLHVLEDDDVWAVRRSPPIGTQRPSVLRWTGGGWLELSPDVPGPSGIWASGSEDVLVSWGNVASGGLTRFDGTLWTRSEMPDGTGELNAVDGSSSENVLSVGNDGQTLHFDGQRWARLPFPTTADLHDVVTVSPSMAVAVGVSGTVGVFDGSEWTLATAPTDETLYGIWSDGSDYWVVGDGVILHGTDPRSLALRTDWPSDDVYWLNDVTKTPDGAVYIVATRGNVLRLESDAWFHDDLGTARSFHAVAVSPSRVWLGGNGLVERRLEIP